MNVLVLFEFSGTVRDAFIRAGHHAVSVDIIDTESKGPHIVADLTYPIDLWMDNHHEDWDLWDMVIAHPPCTFMSCSGNRWYAGTQKRQDAADWINRVWKIPVKKLCIENPVGQINKYLPHFPKPQYIQPWQFGHGELKNTGLWKRNLPDLIPTNIVEGRSDRIHKMPGGKNQGKKRSVFYPGIADAMADQWGNEEFTWMT